MSKTEITTTTSGFLKLHDFNMSAAMAEELDGLNVNFERIKIPAGGSTVFELPGEETDEPEMAKEFSGVILWHHPLFAFYTDKY
ncbi:MAG TPA: hypothetical protein PKW29_13090, partial [Clostridia bacterium]|nr:hypothetical protein [Clostridia bacterium]